MASIQLQNLSKTYAPGVAAVRDLCLDVRDGEMLVLLGPSGSGKTTTLRLIAGLENPDAGQILCDGKSLAGCLPSDRNVAMVFQDAALYPHMSVRHNLAFPLKSRGLKKQEISSRVEEAADVMDVAELLDRRPHTLSGGQRQRVALAKALIRQPVLFLFDEPLSHLDAPLRARLRTLIKDLHRRLGFTAVYVTHDQDEAMALADRIAILAEGALQQVDTPISLYDCPANRFVAEFIGTPAMNFFPARLEHRDSHPVLLLAGQTIGLPEPIDGASLLNGEVEVGLRPEDILFEPGDDPGGALQATVDRIDLMAPRRQIALHLDAGPRFIALAGMHLPLQPGDRTVVYPRWSRVHFFEPGPYGRRLYG